MYPFAVLSLLAGLSAAWLYPDQSPAGASRLGRPLRRAVGDPISPDKLAPGSTDPATQGYFTVYGCPDPNADPHTNNKLLDRGDLAQAQSALIQACKTTDQFVQADAKGPGLQKSFGSVAVQLCNMDEDNKSWQCDPGYLARMLDQIWCGDKMAPQAGYGQVKKKGDTNGLEYYVYYGPSDNVPKCKNTNDYYQMAVKANQPCDNAAFQSACGVKPQTSDSTIGTAT